MNIRRSPGFLSEVYAGLVLALVLSMASSARAEGAQPAKLVLIVANNRGAALGRPELHYADDDGAKYRELFRASAAVPSDVQLLARFDRDTTRLFSEVPDGAPTRAVLEQKVAALVARSVELRAQGRTVEFHFVYAGHGDVDRGKGFVQLEDGTFTADDLAALVRRVDAARAHVILDSCNSFFLVSPRKPGGRHVATTDDAVRALRERMPRVGVFLSTSADGEVFEWSELGAGIFSHAVRSGLSGAADANRDGEVSYAELSAFVDVATQEVKNPRYRPKVFARGPDGDARAALFVQRLGRGRRLMLDGPVRATLRDATDIPWIDAHVEPGAHVELVVPTVLDEGRGTKEILEVSGDASRVVRREAIDDSATPRRDLVAARGPNELFRTLFARPFGPRAFAAEVERPLGPEVQAYGLSRDDITRFSTLLDQVAETERSRRVIGGLAIFGTGLVAGGVGAVLLNHDDTSSRSAGLGYLSAGIGFAIVAPIVALRHGPGETLRTEFARDIARADNESAAVANAETRLFEVARRERTYRIVGAALSGALLAIEGVGFTLNELRSTPDPQMRGAMISLAMLTSASGIMMLQPSPIERLADVWRAEPTRPTSRWSLSPVGPAGPGLSFSGSF